MKSRPYLACHNDKKVTYICYEDTWEKEWKGKETTCRIFYFPIPYVNSQTLDEVKLLIEKKLAASK